jgi:hypothetical protein
VKYPPEPEDADPGADETAPAEVTAPAGPKRRKRLDAERCELLLLDADLGAETILFDRLRGKGFGIRELTRGRILRAALHAAVHRCGMETAMKAVLVEEEAERAGRKPKPEPKSRKGKP